MNATTNEARLAGLNIERERASESDAVRFANYAALNTIPMAIFGATTIFYIVSSLLALA